jgi:WD40 repeat protein
MHSRDHARPCTLSHHQPYLLFSGGDDCAFKAWDCRGAAPVVAWQPPAGDTGDAGDSGDDFQREPGAPVFFDRRTHAAGVCCVAPHPTREHLVATGSYDEGIRLWDLRKATRPVVKAQVCREHEGRAPRRRRCLVPAGVGGMGCSCRGRDGMQ